MARIMCYRRLLSARAFIISSSHHLGSLRSGETDQRCRINTGPEKPRELKKGRVQLIPAHEFQAWCESCYDPPNYSNQLWDAVGTGKRYNSWGLRRLGRRRILQHGGLSVMLAALKIKKKTLSHRHIVVAACGQSVTHCRRRDSPPRQLFWPCFMIRRLMFCRRFHTETLILMKHWVRWPCA